MKENTINLEVVLSDGRIIHTGGPGRHFQKSSAGYNLTELMVGSEGTLGIITQATVRLHAAPEHTHALIATFETIENSLACANLVLQNGVPVGRMEFVDPKSIDVINKHSNLDNDVKPTLFFELIGSPASVEEQLETVKVSLVRPRKITNYLFIVHFPQQVNKISLVVFGRERSALDEGNGRSRRKKKIVESSAHGLLCQ